MRGIAVVAALALALQACRGQASTAANPESATSAAASAATPSVEPVSATSAAAPTAPGAPPPPQAPPAKPVPAQLPEVLATIDGERIERWELEGAIKGLEARAGAPIPADRRDQIVRSLLDQIVDYHLLSREARERKIAVTDAEVTAQISQIKGGFPNEQAFQQALTAQGITLDQLQRQTRMGMDIDKVLQAEVAPKIKVEDAEIGTFYKQNLAQFEQGESVHASHILIATPQGAQAAEKDAAKAKAQDVLKQVKAGGDFAALAKAQSQDPGSAQGGGDLGFFPKGQTDPAFEAAAFALKPGGISEVVETQFGYHVIKVHEQRAARTAPLEEVSGQIREFLTGQQRESAIQAFLATVKAKRKVEILV